MKKQKSHPRPLLTLCSLLLAIATTPGLAQTLYYDRGANDGWLAPDAWSTVSGGSGDTDWSNAGATTASFGAGSALTMVTSDNTGAGLTINVAAMTNTGGLVTIQKNISGSPSLSDVLTFSPGATINGDFSFGSRVTVTGSFEVESGDVTMGGLNNAAINGTATVSSGASLDFTQNGSLGATTNLVVDGGLLRIGFANASRSFGALTIDSGTFELGRSTNTTTTLTTSSLSGDGGTLRVRTPGGSQQGVSSSLTVNQDTNTTYAGEIVGTGDNGVTNVSTFSLTKSGAGDLTLSGTISAMQKTTTVNGGRLYINGNSTSFGDNVGSTAISVASGGTLGGTGTISTLAGDSVVVANGGALTAGLLNEAGTTTYALGAGGSVDLSAATAGDEWLTFELGGLSTPGTSYDQIVVSGGSLVIGSGLLNFADFSFTALSGFGEGTYVLFSNAALSGTLAESGLSGIVNGHDAVLGLSGNDIVLMVAAVPEPNATVLLALSGIAFVVLRTRRHRRCS